MILTRRTHSVTSTTQAVHEPVECAPWCEYGDGHPGLKSAEDQWCGTWVRQVPTVLYPSVEQADGTYAPETIQAFGRLDHDGPSAPRVEVGLGDAAGFAITPTEARQLAAVLVEIADEIEEGTR